MDIAKIVTLEMNLDSTFPTKLLVIRKKKYLVENNEEHEN